MCSKDKHRIFLLIFWLISVLATGAGAVHTFCGDASGFSRLFWPLGFSTWDDCLVFGILFSSAVVSLGVKGSPVHTGLFFSTYAVLRTFFETLYNMLVQFSPTSRPWEKDLPAIAAKFNLKIIELHVVAQVFYMSLCVVSIMVFLCYLKQYWNLGSKK